MPSPVGQRDEEDDVYYRRRWFDASRRGVHLRLRSAERYRVRGDLRFHWPDLFCTSYADPRGKSEYADVLERALYNNVIGSMSQDGKRYFYVNPLEVWPNASAANPDRKHVKPTRQKWFGCACCPPNVARLLSSLNQYIYTVDEASDTIYTHLFIGSEGAFDLDAGRVELHQISRLPWHGDVRFELSTVPNREFTLAFRVPAWSNGQAVMKVNGELVKYDTVDGYAILCRRWTEGDVVEWKLWMEAQWISAHPEVRANGGKAALVRGPLVYCFEETDNGSALSTLSIDPTAQLRSRTDHEFSGLVVIETDGYADDRHSWQDHTLYRPLAELNAPGKKTLKAIPYYLWGNREPGEMAVWVRVRAT